MPEAVYNPKFGIDGPIKLGPAGASASGGTALTSASGPALSLSKEMTVLDIASAGMVEVSYAGAKKISVTFNLTALSTSGGSYPPDVEMILVAFSSGNPLAAYIEDSSLGDIDGDFEVSKMDENRENKKAISWSVELVPTWRGRPFTITPHTASAG